VFAINVATGWLLDQLRVIADEIGRGEIARIARNMVVDMPRSLARHFFRDFFPSPSMMARRAGEICPFIRCDLSFFENGPCVEFD
jgi:hypothetical protein